MTDTPRCTCQWADDDGDPEVGPDPYIAVVNRDCPMHGEDKAEEKPKPFRLWVNAYSVSREYGGPEEGGWWYDWYECKASCPIRNDDRWEERAQAITREMKEALGWEPDRYEENHGGARFTVNGGPDFLVLTEDEESESQSLERPRYE